MSRREVPSSGTSPTDGRQAALASPSLFKRDDLVARGLLVAWAVVVFVFWVPLQRPISWHWFELAARLLVGDGAPGEGRGGLHLYESHPEFQFGPMAVAVTVVVRLVGGGHAMMLARVLAAALAPVVLWTLEGLARREFPPADLPRIRRLSLVAGVLLIPAWDLVAVRTVHIDDAIALSASVGALAMARRDRPWWSAGLLGLAIGAKPWAVAFLPILLLLRRHRTRAIILAGVLGSVVWVPFLVAAPGTVEALRDFRLAVAPRSALHLLGLDTVAAPVWLRPVQFVASLAVAIAAVARGRWQGVIFVAMATRILLDPAVHSYHLTGLVVGAVAWDLTWCRRRWPVWTVCPVVLLTTRLTAIPHGVAGAIRLGLSLIIIVAVLAGPARRMDRSPRRSGSPPARTAHRTLASRMPGGGDLAAVDARGRGWRGAPE
jgi:hypothetical protein